MDPQPLPIHYFGTKEGLFVAATGLPAVLPELFGSLAALPLHDCVQALVRGYLHVVDSDKSRNAILALVRSAVSNDKAAAMLREFLTAQLLPVIARLTRPPGRTTKGSPGSGTADRHRHAAPRPTGRATGQGKPRRDRHPGHPRHRTVPAVRAWDSYSYGQGQSNNCCPRWPGTRTAVPVRVSRRRQLRRSCRR